jgi:hypothetical protein
MDEAKRKAALMVVGEKDGSESAAIKAAKAGLMDLALQESSAASLLAEGHASLRVDTEKYLSLIRFARELAEAFLRESEENRINQVVIQVTQALSTLKRPRGRPPKNALARHYGGLLSGTVLNSRLNTAAKRPPGRPRKFTPAEDLTFVEVMGTAKKQMEKELGKPLSEIEYLRTACVRYLEKNGERVTKAPAMARRLQKDLSRIRRKLKLSQNS